MVAAIYLPIWVVPAILLGLLFAWSLADHLRTLRRRRASRALRRRVLAYLR